jgi:hypothetical protein
LEGRGFKGCGKTPAAHDHPGARREALECGSLLPLSPQPARWLGTVPLKARCKVLGIEASANPASKLAGQKAAASCRTPKRAAPAQAAVPLGGRAKEFFRSLFSPAANAAYKFLFVSRSAQLAAASCAERETQE